MKTNGNTALIDNHQVLLFSNGLDSYHLARIFRDVECLYTLTATVCYTVVAYDRTLTLTLLTHNEYGLLLRVVDAYHADDFVRGVVLIKSHTAYTRCSTAHGANCIFVKVNSTTIAVGHDNIVRAVCQHNAYHLVVLTNVDSVHTIRAWT